VSGQDSGQAARRQFIYRQEKGSEYRVVQAREGARLTVQYLYADQKSYQNDGLYVRNLSTGQLESCELVRPAGTRRYEFTPTQVTVTRPGKAASTHSIARGAHPELLDAICAFVATGKASERVLYVFNSDSFRTQGFEMKRIGTRQVATTAGTFDCVVVRLSLDFPAGLFFSLEILVAPDAEYPFVVSGRTTTGGAFQLVQIL
jgi:hypothetical protein